MTFKPVDTVVVTIFTPGHFTLGHFSSSNVSVECTAQAQTPDCQDKF